jgi:hypothetical protein
MRHLRVALIVGCAAVSIGCFQVATAISVNGDGSGTIVQRVFLTNAGAAQLGQLSMLSRGGQRIDPLSEDAARAAASQLGAGVTYVISTPTTEAGGQSRTITYAFTDINQVRLPLQPPGAPAGVTMGGAQPAITCALSVLENGNAQLRITVPQPFPADGGSGLPPIEQLAMIRTLIAGARVSVVLEPSGPLVRASSPYVDGNRVTLVDIDADQVLTDENLARIRAAKTPEELKAALAASPGLKLPLEGDVTIEFSRSK